MAEKTRYSDILNTVNQFTGNAFPAKLFCYGYIQSNSQFSFVGNQPSRNIFAKDFDISSFYNHIRTIQLQSIRTILFQLGDSFL